VVEGSEVTEEEAVSETVVAVVCVCVCIGDCVVFVVESVVSATETEGDGRGQ